MIITLNDDEEAKVLDALERATERGGAGKWAIQHGFTPAFICLVRSRRRSPSRKLVEALGFNVTFKIGD
jgi:hypothetical protein